MTHRPRRIRVALARGAVTTVVALTLVVTSTPTPALAKRATNWDPRLAPIAHKVEKLRHLRFEHAVPAEVLPPAKFRKRVTQDHAKTTKKQRRSLAVSEAELRALGLVAGNFDLFRATNDVQGSSVLAYYDSHAKKIVVRGTTLDAEARITLAHELTHALQDQHYDLERLDREAKSSGAQDAELALVEGDATRIENKYYAGLSAKDQRFIDRAEGPNGSASGQPAVPDIAAQAASEGIIGAELDAPYALGPQMVDAILAADHRPGLASAFRHPPNTQLDFVLPSQALGRKHLAKLTRPSLPHGARRLAADEPDDFGAADLFFLLASRIPAPTALRAADTWSNGRELISRAADGRTCVDVALATGTRSGADRLNAALTIWAASLPGAEAHATRSGARLYACDPGRAAGGPPNTAQSALKLAAIRSSLVGELVGGGAPGPIASCIGDRMLDRPEFAIVVAQDDHEPTKAEIASVRSMIDDLIAACR